MHDLMHLNEEVILFGSVVGECAKRLFPHEPVDFFQRRVLRTLREKSPITLADLARERCVTRQHARKVVQNMLEGLITTQPNPCPQEVNVRVLDGHWPRLYQRARREGHPVVSWTVA